MHMSYNVYEKWYDLIESIRVNVNNEITVVIHMAIANLLNIVVII